MSEQTIIEGDCLEVMKTFADKSFDLVLTDPPYGINVGGGGRKPLSESLLSPLVKVGIHGKSPPKVTRDLMTPESRQKNTLQK